MNESSETEILAVLSEASEENVPTILNTILVHHAGDPRERLLVIIEEVLESLDKRGYLQLVWHRDTCVPLTDTERHRVFPLAQAVQWNEGAKRWSWNESKNPERPAVILTKAGEDYAGRILRVKGWPFKV